MRADHAGVVQDGVGDEASTPSIQSSSFVLAILMVADLLHDTRSTLVVLRVHVSVLATYAGGMPNMLDGRMHEA